MALAGAGVTRVVCVALLVAGCTHAIAGTARPAAGLKPNPLIGDVIKQVLLDDVVLANMLKQGLQR